MEPWESLTTTSVAPAARGPLDRGVDVRGHPLSGGAVFRRAGRRLVGMDNAPDALHVNRNEDLEFGLLLGGCKNKAKGKDGDCAENDRMFSHLSLLRLRTLFSYPKTSI